MKYFFIVFLFICSISSTAFGQQQSDLSISAFPEYPAPGATVTLTLGSYDVNVDQSSVVWRYNNKLIDGGAGKKSITVVAPGAGSVGVVTASVTGAGFGSTTVSYTLRPGSIDLVWEAVDAYTPPFYKGKALASTNSLIRVVGISAASAPKQFVYTWSRNDTTLGSLSGLNRSNLLFRNNELDTSELIGLTGQSGNFTGSASITIPITNPSMVVYEKEDGFINYAKGFSNAFATKDPGVILRIEPFFFSVASSVIKSLAFTVMQNDLNITNPSVQNELYLSAPSAGGNSNIQIVIDTITETFQSVTRNFTISFN